MRRALVAAVAVPVLLLAACGAEEGPSVTEAPAAEETQDQPDPEPTEEETTEVEPTEEETTEVEPTEEETTEVEPTEEETTEVEPTEEETTEVEPTEEETTDGGSGGEEGSEEDGAAASAKVKEVFQVMFSEDPGQLCDLMVNFEGTGPMAASESDLSLCREVVVPAIEAELGSVGDREQIAGILDLLEIAPARIEGDTARVGAEEFGELFGSGFGDGDFVLTKFDGEWYVDIQASDL